MVRPVATASLEDKYDLWRGYIWAAAECLSPNGKNCPSATQNNIHNNIIVVYIGFQMG
jgi:hypothetical protein